MKEGPDGKNLGPEEQALVTDSGLDTDPALTPPESVGEERSDNLAANKGEPEPVGTLAIPPTGDLDGPSNGSSAQRKEGDKEAIAREPKLVGILAEKRRYGEIPRRN